MYVHTYRQVEVQGAKLETIVVLLKEYEPMLHANRKEGSGTGIKEVQCIVQIVNLLVFCITTKDNECVANQ